MCSRCSTPLKSSNYGNLKLEYWNTSLTSRVFPVFCLRYLEHIEHIQNSYGVPTLKTYSLDIKGFQSNGTQGTQGTPIKARILRPCVSPMCFDYYLKASSLACLTEALYAPQLLRSGRGWD